ncbi:MAG: polysaccharide deacetylase family protein [Deltaproteobacteria bacterium]|nr:polysaccharide deacetylase family protein [Deltaproteobacteria bacterium]
MLGLSFHSRRRQIPVLMFHGLCERIPDYALFEGGRTCHLPVTDFAAVIRWCCQNYDVIRLSDLDDLLARGGRGYRPLLLTFDDGLASAIDLGLPILRNYGVSAVMFVTTGITDAGRTPDIFYLEKVVYQCLPADVRVRFDGEEIQLKASSKEEVGPCFHRLWSWLVERRFPPLRVSLQDVSINGRPVIRGLVSEDRHFWFPASWNELKAAAREGILEIGSHMVSHRPLTWLSRSELIEEIEGSRRRLEQELEVAVQACAYPHGFVDEEVSRVAGVHYRWGFADSGGLLKKVSQRLSAPRIHVASEDWTVIKRLISPYGRAVTHLRFYGGTVKKRLLTMAGNTVGGAFRMDRGSGQTGEGEQSP